MNLADERLKELDNPSLTKEEAVALRCRLVSKLIHEGQYETAREALGGLWRGIGERPDVEGLYTPLAADVLLQSGVLTGWLGRAGRISGAQEKAKDLISEALRMFSDPAKASEAQYELGMCYFRLGAFDEARVVLDEALEGLTDDVLRARILIRHTLIEVWTGRYRDAWDILERAKEFFEQCSDAIKGRWHGQRGLVLRKLATAERRTDYADRAIIEFTAAIHYYEQAGHERYCANNFNNLAMLLYQFGRYQEAHDNLDRAQLIFTKLKDPGNLAQVDETRARVLVAERKYTEAGRIIASVIHAFERGGDSALLADAMTLQGVIRARTGNHAKSLTTLKQAIHVAEAAGATSIAALATLTLIEEHGARRMPEIELLKAYQRTDDLLRDTQDQGDIMRLRACAGIIIGRIAGFHLHDRNFSLIGTIHDIEARYIEKALEESQGSITQAARLLGIARQSLDNLLKNRHRRLLSKRTPAQPRKRSIIKPGS
jgi:tetratricopeptide (TPR) repeat protein